MENIVMDNVATIALGPYTNLIGNWFWAFILFLAVSVIYIRTKSFGPAYLSLVVGSLIMDAILPGGPLRTVLFFSVVFGIVYTAYRFLVRRSTGFSE